MNKTT